MPANKDPAVLWYTSDFLSGTAFFTMEQRGQYVTLLCEQHQNGHIPEGHMIDICQAHDSPVMAKFKKDGKGLWFNERMEFETIRRSNYCTSRRKNRFGGDGKGEHMSPHMSIHTSRRMENENENEIRNEIKRKNGKSKFKDSIQVRQDHYNAKLKAFKDLNTNATPEEYEEEIKRLTEEYGL